MRSSGSSSPIWKRRHVPGVRPGFGGAVRLEWHAQALEAAPGKAHAEEFEPVQEPSESIFALRLEHRREQPACTGEIAPPQLMAARARQGRVEHFFDFGTALQPVGDLECALHVALEPDIYGAQASERQIHVIRPGELTECLIAFLEARPSRLAAGNRSHHRIGVADDIFRCRVHGDVAAMGKDIEILRRPTRCCPRRRGRRLCARPRRSPERPAFPSSVIRGFRNRRCAWRHE